MDPLASPATVPQTGVISHGHMAPWDKVAFNQPAAWIEPLDYDASLPGKAGDHITHLLWARQVNAGTGRSFHSTSVRLETSMAVQHHSQWSVQLDPRTQTLSLHWLRVVRGDQRIDHLHRDRMRLIQREAQLELHVIDGIWTLMTVLDDVRPGDIIEAGFSYEEAHPIMPGATETFFVVPPYLVVGRYCFSATADAGNTDLTWKASADAPALREDTLTDGRRRWTWEGSQLTPREPEPNQSGSFLDYTWIQISDLTQWQKLAVRVSTVWDRHGDAEGLAAITAFQCPGQVDEAAVTHLIQYIQDEFRYLSLNLELGGWIPASPAQVIRRRYGDCKDLAWLATAVLRSWGLTACPVLVGTGLREQVATLLPMPFLFNHAVLEVEVAGKTRWFDLTTCQQGGDFDGRPITWFGFGLPIHALSEGLRAQPGTPGHSAYAVRETILLDTRRGAVSLVEQRILAQGWQADDLRHTRHTQGADEFSKNRDQLALRRYGRNRRVGTLQWRDDRLKNTCEIVEVFEIPDAVYPDETGQRALFDVPPNLVLQSFTIPENKPRRTPWAMPFPLEIRHEIIVKAPGMTTGNRRNRRWDDVGFSASLDEPKPKDAWAKIARITVKAAEIQPGQITAFRTQLEKFLIETGWRLYLPWGFPRARRGNGFGELSPESTQVRTDLVAPPTDKEVRPTIVQPEINLALKLDSGPRRQRRRRSSRSASTVEMPAWAWRLIWFLLCAFVVGLIRACSKGGF